MNVGRARGALEAGLGLGSGCQQGVGASACVGTRVCAGACVRGQVCASAWVRGQVCTSACVRGQVCVLTWVHVQDSVRARVRDLRVPALALVCVCPARLVRDHEQWDGTPVSRSAARTSAVHPP